MIFEIITKLNFLPLVRSNKNCHYKKFKVGMP